MLTKIDDNIYIDLSEVAWFVPNMKHPGRVIMFRHNAYAMYLTEHQG